MSFLLDTNIISEVRKGEKCDPHVSAWYASIADADLYLSALVLGEIRKRVELARAHDPGKAAALETWLDRVELAFGNRVLEVDNAVAQRWGRMSALRPTSVFDCLMAATAAVNRMTLVTRNDGDVAGLGVSVLNPFRPR